MTRMALAILAFSLGFVVNAAAQGFTPPDIFGRVYFKNLPAHAHAAVRGWWPPLLWPEVGGHGDP
jgi:hypothetical protein